MRGCGGRRRTTRGRPWIGLVLLVLGHHAVDLLLRRRALVVGDGDAVRLAGGLVLGGDVEHTVGIDVEGDLDMRDITRSGRNAGELEFAQEMVVLGAGWLSA